MQNQDDNHVTPCVTTPRRQSPEWQASILISEDDRISLERRFAGTIGIRETQVMSRFLIYGSR